ncbi:hypothetical protein LCGC14_1773100 [marine sediment metagenome]|uniref:Uncharacterized protein n=1 Tax=marine sediment metagenome TaxID=412755 RepID=A0A0F9JXC1_9ZZZZ
MEQLRSKNSYKQEELSNTTSPPSFIKRLKRSPMTNSYNSDTIQRTTKRKKDEATLKTLIDGLPPIDEFDPDTLVSIGLYGGKELIQQIIGFMNEEDEYKSANPPLKNHRCYNALQKMNEFFGAWDIISSALNEWQTDMGIFTPKARSSWFSFGSTSNRIEIVINWLERIRNAFVERSAARKCPQVEIQPLEFNPDNIINGCMKNKL